MEYEILESPISFQLHGKMSVDAVTDCGTVGFALMNAMWQTLRDSKTSNKGINHWVYLPGGRMFVGVELVAETTSPQGLEPLQFELNRYLRHTHVGPYQNLPAKWNMLREEMQKTGHTLSAPSLEIYDHHVDDPMQLRTTILISIK